MTWPRLSVTLTGLQQPGLCQSCSGAGDERWQEHDEHDRPEPIIVGLCRGCSGRLVERHPRLYRMLQKYEPWPGAMEICVDCRHREGTRCPLSKAQGGAGVKLTVPAFTKAIVCGSGPGRGMRNLYVAPVSACEQREPRA